MTQFFKKKKLPLRLFLDMFILPVSIWLAFALRFDNVWPAVVNDNYWLLFTAPLLAIPIFFHFGLYRAVPEYVSIKGFYSIVKAISLHATLLFLISLVTNIHNLPETTFIIYWFISLTLVSGSRVLMRSVLKWQNQNSRPYTNVVVYGAGSAGAELVGALQSGDEFFPVAFIDDKRELHGKEIRGLRVYPTRHLRQLIDRYHVRQVLLAIPSANRVRRKQVILFLEQLHVHVRSVPTLVDIVIGRSKIEDLREIDIEDILGREPIPPNPRLLATNVTGKTVMVTGAGGSIGSEICHQIVNLRPRRLILFEISEYALYNIEKELKSYLEHNKISLPKTFELIPILGSVSDSSKLNRIFDTFSVQTVYHAAAYKHVPLVECNPIEGLKNNVFGTWKTAKAVMRSNVETFILISTDKAVRPTNVMGATKRIAELVVQALAKESTTTIFSIVRFGNVLDSSGSVVPLFRQQINRGGPVTLTHPEMTRYFMTIPEAAHLVIQAGAMASGGEIFVLDMGEPVRIYDLAERMIYLSGHSLKTNENSHGDISIVTTKPRPGEKLYEELLLGENVTKTAHPRIMRAHEKELTLDTINEILKQLKNYCDNYNIQNVRDLLLSYVEGYAPQCGIEDTVWLASNHAIKSRKIAKTPEIGLQSALSH